MGRGLIGAAGIAACTYMVVHGFGGWPVFWIVVLTILLVALLAFLINLLLRWTGLHPKANYFYSVETEGNFLLEIFHRWIPVPFLYLIPSYVILLPYMVLVTVPFEAAERARGKKAKTAYP